MIIHGFVRMGTLRTHGLKEIYADETNGIVPMQK